MHFTRTALFGAFLATGLAFAQAPFASPQEDEAFLAHHREAMTATWDAPFWNDSRHAPLGPYLGNGDVGAVAFTTASSQTLRMTKVDFVTDGVRATVSGKASIGALPIGGVTVRVESPERKEGFAYAMDTLGNELRMMPATEAKVRLRSWIAAEENLVTVEVRSEERRPRHAHRGNLRR